MNHNNSAKSAHSNRDNGYRKAMFELIAERKKNKKKYRQLNPFGGKLESRQGIKR